MKCSRMMFACLAAGMSLAVMGNPIAVGEPQPKPLQTVEVKSPAADQYAKEMQQAIAAISLADQKLLDQLGPDEKAVYLCIPIPPSEKERKENAQPKVVVRKIDVSGTGWRWRRSRDLPHQFTIDGQEVMVDSWFDCSGQQYRFGLPDIRGKRGCVLHAIGVQVKSRGFFDF